MARNPIERALGVWSGTNYRSVMLPGLGVVTCGELCDAITALKAENERLAQERQDSAREWRTAFDSMQQRANEAERALAERAGGVRVVGNIPGSSSASGFAPLTTEPAAPEGRHDDCHTDADGYPYEFTRPAEQAVTGAQVAAANGAFIDAFINGGSVFEGAEISGVNFDVCMRAALKAAMEA